MIWQILFYVAMFMWLVGEIIGVVRSNEKWASTGQIAWFAVLFLGIATLGFPK